MLGAGAGGDFVLRQSFLFCSFLFHSRRRRGPSLALISARLGHRLPAAAATRPAPLQPAASLTFCYFLASLLLPPSRPPCSLPPPPPAGSPPSPRAPAASRLPASRVLPPSGMSCSPGTPCPGRRGTAVAARLRSPPPRAPWSPGEGRLDAGRLLSQKPSVPTPHCTLPPSTFFP
uniref:Vegetative cell wall protein gp1-like n=1 Tax=Tursiops truncatus TaxID=9739 RepID=A0A6J3R0H3_TURTR|nr:vegetative cell wall protein gp1-like [Tursiops truncatus]